jgi:hypothetical protein
VSRPFAELIGHVISKVELSDDRQYLRVWLENEQAVIYQAEGDCCSHSWFDQVTVRTYCKDPVEAIKVREEHEGIPTYQDVDRIYGFECTARASYSVPLAVELRNSSNGYYGGSVELVAASRLPLDVVFTKVEAL